MSGFVMAQVLLAAAAFGWTAEKPEADTVKARIAVGKAYVIKLDCNPTTGYDWELKSIDREIAAPKGSVEFKRNKAPRGMVGVPGMCTLEVVGVKPGKTKAVLVYRRSWEKDVAPARTFTAEITVVKKK